jgi:hypothetical protein
MIPTSDISKEALPKLADDVLRLLAMGQYSLFRVSVKDRQDIVYALRTGAKDVFFLKADGEAVDENLPDFQVQEKVKVKDCQPGSIPLSRKQGQGGK